MSVEAAFAAAGWRKSSYSGGENACIEVAAVRGAVALRDSKDPEGPALVFPPSRWRALITAARDGKLDLT